MRASPVLAAARATERLDVVGPNSVEDAQRLWPLRLLWRQVESPLVLILIFAVAVSLGLSEWVDAAIILAMSLAPRCSASTKSTGRPPRLRS